MSIAGKIAVVLVAGIALGILSAWFMITRSADIQISNGPWRTNVVAGSPESDRYTRAYVAMHDLFALDRSEALYYTASEDDAGRALEGLCRYEISGQDPDASWWSIAAYGSDGLLVPNSEHRQGFSQLEVRRDPKGAFSVVVGTIAAEGDWIPVAAGPFTLTLRLYGPGNSVLLDPARTPLPVLKRISCS